MGIESLFYFKSKDSFLCCKNPIRAVVFYKDFQINLLTGKRKDIGIEELISYLSEIEISREFIHPLVIHLNYELGFHFNDLDDFIPTHEPLAFLIQYENAEFKRREVLLKKDQDVLLDLKNLPSFEEYKSKFDSIYEKLLLGECYQVNLTYKFYFQFKKNFKFKDFYSKLWKDKNKIAAFAHGTYIRNMDYALVSNSPESLFMMNEDHVIKSTPIKGTLSLKKNEEIEKKWKELKSSKKNESELFMITDLLRNDLTKIALTPSKVEKLKAPLVVPGLIHQYSVISTRLSKDISLFKILNSLFPGGSITGAPKKNVMKIIKILEKNSREAYCGSTLLCYKNSKSASINIRTSEINFETRELSYGAGGGITLNSKASEEYEEMLLKMKSFIDLVAKA